MIKIIVDSTCDLPEEIIKEQDIATLSLRVSLEGTDYLDKETIQVDEVYAAMREGVLPKTSQPNLKEMHDLFYSYASKGWDFIYLAFSSALSGTYQAAHMVVEELKEKFPNVNMEVVDSKSGSTATGLIALQTLKQIEAGKSYKKVIGVINELVGHIEHIFTISDLNWLIKGGRISKVKGAVGSVLNIKPILHVNNGIMEVIKMTRGKKKALKTVVDLVEERIKDFPNQVIGISHADDIDTANELQDMMKARLGERKIIVNKIGSVLGAHLGIGGVGVFFFNNKIDSFIE